MVYQLVSPSETSVIQSPTTFPAAVFLSRPVVAVVSRPVASCAALVLETIRSPVVTPIWISPAAAPCPQTKVYCSPAVLAWGSVMICVEEVFVQMYTVPLSAMAGAMVSARVTLTAPRWPPVKIVGPERVVVPLRFAAPLIATVPVKVLAPAAV